MKVYNKSKREIPLGLIEHIIDKYSYVEAEIDSKVVEQKEVFNIDQTDKVWPEMIVIEDAASATIECRTYIREPGEEEGTIPSSCRIDTYEEYRLKEFDGTLIEACELTKGIIK